MGYYSIVVWFCIYVYLAGGHYSASVSGGFQWYKIIFAHTVLGVFPLTSPKVCVNRDMHVLCY